MMTKEENDDELKSIFESVKLAPSYKPEKVLDNQLPRPLTNFIRQCRFASIPSNIRDIKQGEYCQIHVLGGGHLTNWYYYHYLNGRHALIFQTALLNNTDDCISTQKFKYSAREISSKPRYDKKTKKVYFGDELPVDGNECEIY